MCIGVGEPDGGQRRERPLDGDQVGDDLDGPRLPRRRCLAQRAIWLRLLPMRATCRVRSRSTSAAGAVQVRTRPTDRRTRSDSVNPAERAFACHSARFASLARIFTHTSRPAPLMYRCRWEGQRGHSPPPAPAGDPRSVASKGKLALPP